MVVKKQNIKFLILIRFGYNERENKDINKSLQLN